MWGGRYREGDGPATVKRKFQEPPGKGSHEGSVGRTAARSADTVWFDDLELSGPVRVRDLWQREDVGVFTDTVSREIPVHGAGRYRMSPAAK